MKTGNKPKGEIQETPAETTADRNPRLGRYGFARALAAEFGKKILLLQRGALAQQLEQRIFQGLGGRIFRGFRRVLELASTMCLMW